jgi:hypothetical protein
MAILLVHGNLLQKRLGLFILAQSNQNVEVLYSNWKQLCGPVFGCEVLRCLADICMTVREISPWDTFMETHSSLC